ncbi:MAG TPA: hypothetical protein VEM59_08425 [Acidimicrobiia bacterium]|nr:hypothetical protein [Acidimicrobiia bacterium]
MSSNPAQLRPLGLGEVLDAGIKIYRNKFATMLKAVAVVIIPVQVLNILVALSLPDTRTTTGGTTTSSGSGWAGVAALLLILVVSIVSSTLAEAACLKAVSDTYLGTDTDWRGSLRFGFERLGSLLWLTLIHGVLLLLAFAACIVPGVWLYAAWSVAVPALLLEGTRGFKALGRSFNLVRGRWWPTAGTLLLANLLAAAVAFGFGVLALPLVFAGGGNEFVVDLANGIFGAAASVLTIPFVAAVVAVIYFDLRVRKEGFDLQLMAQRIGAPAGAVTPAPMPWTAQPAPGAGGGWAPPPPPGWSPPPPGPSSSPSPPPAPPFPPPGPPAGPPQR